MPHWVEFIFQNRFVRCVYVLVMLLLLLVFVPTGPLRALIEAGLLDWVGRPLGDSVAEGLRSLLEQVNGILVLATLLALLAGWLVHQFWASPKTRFVDALRKAGLGLTRGPGSREGFLNRVADCRIPLGLGPTGRLLPLYIGRKEDAVLRHCASEILSDRRSGRAGMMGVVITGPPVAGKTRSAMELASDLCPAVVVVWPRDGGGSDLASLPPWGAPTVILYDNATLDTAPGDFALPGRLRSLISACRRSIVVATARESDMPHEVRGLRHVALSEMSRDDPGLWRAP